MTLRLRKSYLGRAMPRPTIGTPRMCMVRIGMSSLCVGRERRVLSVFPKAWGSVTQQFSYVRSMSLSVESHVISALCRIG
jgi:hypothetical protein